MKLLISSKQLASGLNKIDFCNEFVLQVRGEKGLLILCTDKRNIEMHCEILNFAPIVKQYDVRWDWMRDFVNQIDEQPIVIEIDEKQIKAIIQY